MYDTMYYVYMIFVCLSIYLGIERMKIMECI